MGAGLRARPHFPLARFPVTPPQVRGDPRVAPATSWAVPPDRSSPAAFVVLAAAAAWWFAAGRPGDPGTGPRARNSLLLVTIDTLRADRIGGSLTPSLNALAARGTRFLNARSPVPLTLPAHTSLMTGLLPPDHGVRLNGVHRLAARHADTGDRAARQPATERPPSSAPTSSIRASASPRGSTPTTPRSPAATTSPASWRPSAAATRSPTAPSPGSRAQPGRGAVLPVGPPVRPPRPVRPASRLDRARRRPRRTTARSRTPTPSSAACSRRSRRATPPAARSSSWPATTARRWATTASRRMACSSTRRRSRSRSSSRAPACRSRFAATPRASWMWRPASWACSGWRHCRARMAATSLQPGASSVEAEVYLETDYPGTAGFASLRGLVAGRWKYIGGPERPELYDLSSDPREEADLSGAHPATTEAMGARLRAIGSAAARSTAAAPSAEAAERLRALGYVASGPAPAEPGAAARPSPRALVAVWPEFQGALGDMAGGRHDRARADARAARTRLPRLAALPQQLRARARRVRAKPRGGGRLPARARAVAGEHRPAPGVRDSRSRGGAARRGHEGRAGGSRARPERRRRAERDRASARRPGPPGAGA